MVPLPSPYQKSEEIFLQYSLWEPGLAPGAKSQSIVRASLILNPSEVIVLRLVHTQPLQFISYCSGIPVLALVPIVIFSQEPLC